jgi:hypothetical protein
MEGIDINGIAIDVGCSDTTDAGGADDAVDSVEGRAAASAVVFSALASSSFAVGAASETFESMLVLLVSVIAAGLGNAGLSGREGASEDGRGLFSRCVTALASRSCSREFGRLREEFRDAPNL